ncbi:MAG: CHAD domain-containing protein [Phycisphaera sp.]|nr:CHAD domain-containing protein [Phycisphaera sp.]
MTIARNATSRRAYAANVLLGHLADLQAQIAGVREATDIEYIHKMRVASRRLRNALALFEDVMPAKKFKRWLKQIKTVTKALGAARDLDVQIEFVTEFDNDLKAQGDKAHAPGVERLVLRLTQQREAVQPRVVATMDRLESSGVLKDMREGLLAINVAARVTSGEERDHRLVDDAREIITLRLEQMLAYEPFIYSPQHVEELHQMRIAAKHLRYTLEAYGPAFRSKLKWQTRVAKQVQSQLGDVHDCDVWIDRLPRFIEEERERHHAFFGHLRGFAKIERGIEHLRADREARRELLYKDFVAFWGTQVDMGRWQKLRSSLTGAASPNAVVDAGRNPDDAAGPDGDDTDAGDVVDAPKQAEADNA